MQLWIIVFRLIPGTLIVCNHELYDKEKEIILQLSNKKIWPIILLGSCGNLLDLQCGIGMAKTSASIASILSQTSTIFIIFGWLILKKHFTKNDDMFFHIYNWSIYNYHCTWLKNLILVTKIK